MTPDNRASELKESQEPLQVNVILGLADAQLSFPFRSSGSSSQTVLDAQDSLNTSDKVDVAETNIGTVNVVAT